MTDDKAEWIEYMLKQVKPAPGLERAARDMLAHMYDVAFAQGRLSKS